MALQNQIQQEAAIKGMKSSERSAPTYGQPRGPIIIRGDYAPKGKA